MSDCEPPVVDFRLPLHIWIAARPLTSVLFVAYIHRLDAELPLGSWFTAMTAGFERIERSAGAIVRISFPMIKGLLTAAPIFQIRRRL